MPGFATHYLFGVQMLKFIKEETHTASALTESIERHKTVFQFGLQGPDFFFYHLPAQLRKNKPGTIVHTMRSAAFLKCLFCGDALFQESSSRETARAYAAGFLGHYILDTQMHPYVYYMSGYKDISHEKNLGAHIALETDIDACLLMRYARCMPSDFPAYRAIAFDRQARDVVASVLAYAFQTVFPELHMTKRGLSHAVLSMQKILPLLQDPSGCKRPAAETVERLLFHELRLSPIIPCDDIRYCDDPLNLAHSPWHNPWDPAKASTASVPELIKKASGRYRRAFSELDVFCHTADADTRNKRLSHLCASLQNLSYHSGLPLDMSEQEENPFR